MAKQGKAWKSIELADEFRLTAGLVNHRWPCWSPDGKWLAFAAGDGNDSAWVIVDRRGRVARVLEGPAEGGACFSLGGGFAFGRRTGNTSEIWMTSGGGAPAVRLLGGDGGLYREPAWSPDGTRLVVAHSDDGSVRTRLLQLEVSSGARLKLTDDAARVDARPAFCPDGTTLFFDGAAGPDSAVYALDLGRNELQRATPHGVVYRKAAPLGPTLFVAEREAADAPTRLVLIDWPKARERALIESDGDARDPAACRTEKGKLRLAWSSLPPPNGKGDGKPRRADVTVARVRGIEALLAEATGPHPDVLEVPPNLETGQPVEPARPLMS